MSVVTAFSTSPPCFKSCLCFFAFVGAVKRLNLMTTISLLPQNCLGVKRLCERCLWQRLKFWLWDWLRAISAWHNGICDVCAAWKKMSACDWASGLSVSLFVFCCNPVKWQSEKWSSWTSVWVRCCVTFKCFRCGSDCNIIRPGWLTSLFASLSTGGRGSSSLAFSADSSPCFNSLSTTPWIFLHNFSS